MSDQPTSPSYATAVSLGRCFAVTMVLAAVVSAALALRLGVARPLDSDALHFRILAENMASGKGYMFTGEHEETYWPGQPTMGRMPGWPMLGALALKLAPGASPDAVLRALCLLVNLGVTGLLFLLTWQLFRIPVVAALAALAYAFHPSGLYFAYLGLSEPMFLLLAVAGVVLLLRRLSLLPVAALLLGLSCTVRSNFMLWAVFAAGLALITAFWTRRSLRMVRWHHVAIAIVLYLLPLTLWAARNHGVTGRFPVISTLRGQTFYGGNNATVADTLMYWGYWVFPDQIEGEKTMRELAQSMNEVEIDEYYYNRGWEYVRANWTAMPRLCLGKLVRAYVPVPWKPLLGSYAVSAYRWLLYFAAAAGLAVAWRRTSLRYRICLLAMVATNLLTVLTFWGYVRFAFALEPFFMPFAAIAIYEVGLSVRRRFASTSYHGEQNARC